MKLLLISFMIFGAVLFVRAVEVLPVPAIAIYPDVYYPFDEVLYLEGSAKPASVVTLQLTKQGARPETFTVKSDARGEWVFAEKIPLAAGEWEARARIAGGGVEEQVSDWSNPRVFKVIASGVTVGGINIKFAALVFVIVVLLGAGIALALIFSWRVRRLRAMLVTKEIREAQGAVREGLSELRRDLLDELKLLESSGKNLSPDELSRKEHILRELDTLEKNMEKEIGDIESRM